MSNQTRFPKRDADFNMYIASVIGYLNTHKSRLVITPTALSKLTELNTLFSGTDKSWNSIYITSQNPVLATKTTIAHKTELRSQLESALRILFDDIPKSYLNPNDRSTLNIPLPATKHSRAKNPDTIPYLSIKNRGHLTIDLRISDVSNLKSLSKPFGIETIEIEGAFLPNTTNPPTDFPQETDFRHIASVGRATYQRNYSANQLKGTEYLRARYLNTRKIAGGWSEIISVVVA